MKISFDFDSTLSEQIIQKLARKFIADGHQVWITSSRMNEFYGRPEWNKEVFAVANDLGIPVSRIQLTNGYDKFKYLKGFDMHFDDDQVEIELIEEYLPECCGVLILDP